MNITTNGRTPVSFHVPELKLEASAAELESTIAEHERVEAAMVGILPSLDLALGDEERLVRSARWLREYARVMRANACFIRDSGSFDLTASQHARLDEVADTFDDVIDTLAWTLEGRAALHDLIVEETHP